MAEVIGAVNSITIIEDLVAGHEYREDDRSGSLTRIFRVDGLDSSSRITADALRATGQGAKHIPVAGQFHPTMTDMVVRSVDVKGVGNSRTACKVYVYYAKVRRRLLDVRITGISTNTQTRRDRNGNQMIVGYKGPTTRGGQVTAANTPFPAPKANNGYDYDYVELPFLLPDLILEIQYLERGSPMQKIEKYQRRVNSKPWQGGLAREWLCESITAEIDSPIPLNLGELAVQDVVTGDAMFNWIVTYRFRRSKRPKKSGDTVKDGPGWDPVAEFKDLATGIKPNDIDPKKGGWPEKAKGNGWATFQLYDEADFSELKLVSAVVGDK